MAKRNLEMTVARKMVRMALDRGWTVSVHDSCEWVIKRSRSFAKIVAAVNSTGEDVLMFRDARDNYLGKAWLVWGNAPDELVADCTCDMMPEFDAFIAEHSKYADKYAN